MADTHRYRPRHRRTAAQSGRRWLVWLILIVAMIFLGQWVLAGHGSTPKKSSGHNNSPISLVTDNANTTVTNAANANAPVANLNTNLAPTAPAGSWTGFSLKSCPSAISSFGTKKQIALTFDVAAANDQASQVLTILQQQHVPADFFVTGAMAASDSNFVKSIARDGFAVYNHGQDNKDLTVLTDAEVTAAITKAEAAMTAVTGTTPKPLFRPAFGNTTKQTIKLTTQAGYCTILWTVDAFDWQNTITADQAKQRVLDKAQPGAIVLMHAGYDVTPQFLPGLISALTGQGYTLVSLAQLLNG